MKIVNHLLDYSGHTPQHVIRLFTGNSFITRAGKLVMGRGAARAVRDTYPGIDAALGSMITHLGVYGILMAPSGNWPRLGVFQVKTSFANQAELDLISISGKLLAHWSTHNPGFEFWINYPGVGNGGLDRKLVEPVLQSCHLPDSVTFFIT